MGPLHVVAIETEAEKERFNKLLDGKRAPNLASQAKGAALRALPSQFIAKYGYAPALAESFSDPELHDGNCSAATASEIHTLGGDYVLQVKGNQPTVEAFCEAAFRDMPRPVAITRKGHERHCERKLMSATATPMATGIPFCRSLHHEHAEEAA